MTIIERINDLLIYISTSGGASRFDILRIFPLARELVETQGLVNKYPKIKFYGDWSLHTKLDRKSAKDLLKQIDNVLKLHENSSPNILIIEISKQLSIKTLRVELIDMFTINNLPIFVFNEPSPWTQCASWLLQDLIDKPVIGSEFNNEEMATGWGNSARVIKLEADSKTNSYIKWCIDIGPRVHLTGELLNI